MPRIACCLSTISLDCCSPLGNLPPVPVISAVPSLDRAQTSLAILVSDSLDETLRLCRTAAGQLPGQSYRRATVLQRDFGYQQA